MKDWKQRHKAICKPGSAGKLPSITESEKSLALRIFELGDSVDGDDTEDAPPPVAGHSGGAGPSGSAADEVPFRLRSPGPGQFVDIPAPGAPGGSIRITSNTLDAETLRDIREHVHMRARGLGAN